ncbi:glycosyltransferase [Rhodocyclaceae bacterium SMB388]
MPVGSLHVIASREMGGAERWFARFVRALQRAGDPVRALVRTGSDLSRHHLDGIDTMSLPMRTVWDPISRGQVSRTAARCDAPIVQTYMGRASRLTRLSRTSGKIHVARLGGYYGLHAFRHAHAWVGNTQGLCDWMVHEGFPAARVFHIPNFAEPATIASARENAELRASIGLTDDWMLLHPARFVPVKGHAELLKAIARLPRTIAGRRARLVLLGDGPLRGRLEHQARGLDLGDRIVWAGWTQSPDRWFQAADLVIFPSREEETLGNVILEAWSHRRPLVATAFRGARELIRQGEDGIVVPCDDSEALTDAIVYALTDDALRSELAKHGAHRVAHEFTESAVVSRYRELYRALARA